MYKQSSSTLYAPFLTSIQTPVFDIVINYSEQLDASCVEFPHVHTDYEVYYIMEGTLTLEVNHQRISISSDQFVFVPPNIEHGSIYQPDIEKKYFVIIFNFKPHNRGPSKSVTFESSQHILDTLMENIDRSNFKVAQDRHASHEYINRVQRELSQKDLGWQMMLKNHYASFLIGIFRSLIQTDKITTEDQLKQNVAIQITKYMHHNYWKNITIQDVADAMNICPRHISRIFQEYFGTSFAKTLSIYRVSYAKNYLCDTELSIEKIAHNVGFSSPQALYKLFREREGMTVTQYKSMLKVRKKMVSG